MKEASVTWLQRMTFDADVDGHHVMLDARGESGDDRGPGPMSLVLAAVAACTAMDVVSILRKRHSPFTGLVVRARGEQATDHPHRFTAVELVYEVHGTGVDRADVERAVALSEDKYCSVSATLKANTVVTSRIELADESS